MALTFLRVRQEKRRINEEIVEFRRLHQRREDRRDYDLYDPDALRTSLPCRVGDDDPRLGLASAQKYLRLYRIDLVTVAAGTE